MRHSAVILDADGSHKAVPLDDEVRFNTVSQNQSLLTKPQMFFSKNISAG